MSPWLFLCVALAALNDSFAGLANDKQGPYMVVCRIAEDCSEGDVALKVYSKMQRYNRTALSVKGHLVNKIPLDNKVKWTMQLDQKTAQGYKDNFFFTDFQQKDVCTTLNEYGEESDLKRFFGAIKNTDTPYTNCPIDTGRHEFELNVLLEPFKKFPMFFYNTYRVTLKYYLDFNDPPVRCTSGIFDVVPKKRAG